MRITSDGLVGIATSSPSFRLQIGNNSAIGSTTPETVSLGGTYSSVAGANAKLRLWTDGTAVMGIGISGDSIDYIGTLNNYSHNFYCGTTLRATINQYGIGVGGAVPSSGFGVTFPASVSASSNANTLDDYEEGTWTPNVGGTATYSTQVGTYTKIGDTVRATFHITVSTIGTGLVNGMLGLPFTTDTTAVNFQSGSIGYYGGSVTAVYYMGCYTQVGSTQLSFVGGTSLSGSVANVINVFGNSTQILGCIVYKAA
jgi:hypothetical protein